MRSNARLPVLIAALLLAACASAPRDATTPSASPQPTATPDVAVQWQQQVAAISAGDDTAARGKAITQRLDALGLQWREVPFVSGERKGANLLADVGGPADAPLLLIGAHYDRVELGRGATDNASGSAAVLELATALKAHPLRNHRVAVAFWDLEERGLLGSKAYVADKASEKPALYVNFDVFGWGDTLWMMRPVATPWLDAETAAAAKANTFPLRAGDQYPPTDHMAFLKAKWPAVSFSLTNSDEIDGVLKTYTILTADPKAKPEMPKIMQVIHSDRDTVAELDASHVSRALRTVEGALRAWDAASAN